MMELSVLTVLVVAEVLLVLLIATGGLTHLFLRRKSQDRAAAIRLVKAVKKEFEPRQKALREILLYKYGLQGAATDEALGALDQASKQLFQGLVNSYAKRDAAGFVGLAAQVYALEDQYRALQPKAEQETSPADDDPSIEAIDISPDGAENELRTEITQLREELSNTMDTMAKMMREYAGIFTDDSASKVDKDKLAEWVGGKSEELSDAEAPAGEEVATAPVTLYLDDAIVDSNGRRASLSIEPGEEPLVNLDDDDDLGALAMMNEDGDTAANDDSAEGTREAS